MFFEIKNVIKTGKTTDDASKSITNGTRVSHKTGLTSGYIFWLLKRSNVQFKEAI